MDDQPRSMDDERQHLEDLLNTRINFYLVFASLFFLGTFGSDSIDEIQRTGALVVGTLVSGVISISVSRTYVLVEEALKELRKDYHHPYANLYEKVKESRRLGLLKWSANYYLAAVPWLITAFFALCSVYSALSAAGTGDVKV